MTSSASTFPLDAYHQARLELWRSASIELSIGPESTDPFVQAGIEAVLAWLRSAAASPRALLELYGQPHGPLGRQLRLAGSLLAPTHSPGDHPPRVCWWVVKTALRHVSPKHERRQLPQSHVVGPLRTAS
jgi:hypothetical protein